jgi:hypothetical protein
MRGRREITQLSRMTAVDFRVRETGEDRVVVAEILDRFEVRR